MMQSMKGATQLLGSMNRQMNLPALQRIAMEFERENDIMDQRQEMMDDAIDDVTGLEDEEEEEEVVNQVLDEIGVDLHQVVSDTCPNQCLRILTASLQLGETPSGLQKQGVAEGRIAEAVGGGDNVDDELEARLAGLKKS
jgi:charged multivesicular body protein 2A